jgi:hypothetical protein
MAARRHLPARPPALCAALAAVLACLVAPPAWAAPDQEMILQDDIKVNYPRSDAALERTLETIKDLGTDRIRVTVLWRLVAPDDESEERPDFGTRGASDPRSYPPGRWRRYDMIAKLAQKHGLGVLFTVSGPGPAWADRGRRGRAGVTRPDVAAYGDFVHAVGRRYAGDWPQDDVSFGDPSQTLPRVDHWSIWNEPNFPGWLMPQYSGRRPASPHTYRRLVRAGWEGLSETGHAEDTVLLGETAPFGRSRRKPLRSGSEIDSLHFLRELYCLSGRSRPLRGRSARLRGCPASPRARARFVSDNPGLFRAPGWAHHPYSLIHRPNWRGRGPSDVPLGAIGRLGRSLDRAHRAWRSPLRPRIWITEYGYQTRPDPYRAVPFARQAAWMSWAEFETYRRGRVASFAQFLLDDDRPDPRYSRRVPRAWITWQSGLRTSRGRPKPAFEEYRRPIFVTPTRRPRGRRVRVFGTLRPAADFAEVPARIEFRRTGSGRWRTLRSLTAAGARGYVDTRVRVPGSGRVRIAFGDPAGDDVVHTRGVIVRTR